MFSDDRRRALLPYVAGTVILAFLLIRALSVPNGAKPVPIALDNPSAQPAHKRPRGARIWVHVAGAVRSPGLYRIAAEARAGTAVDAAGGFARRADLRAINLAASIRDGQQIVVPRRGEQPAATALGPASESPPPGAAGVPGPAGAGGGAKVSLSGATVEQLDALDGIGPTLAQRILQWRDAHGGFKSVEQLREVEGIGEKRFEALRSVVQP